MMLSLQKRQNLVGRGLLIAYLTLAAFFVAHTINAFVSKRLLTVPQTILSVPAASPPAEILLSPSKLAQDIRASGLFPVVQELLEVSAPGQPALLRKPPLDVARKIRLLGTAMGEREGVSAVIEELQTKQQHLFRLHDVIPNVGELSEIRKDGVVIRQDNQQEFLGLLAMDQPKATVQSVAANPAQAAQPLRRILDRREINQALSDVSKLLTQAHAVPYFTNGAIDGFRLDFIAPASLYEKIGLRYGDVLQRVNGVELRDPGTMFNLFQKLKDERSVKLDVLRSNQRTTMTYEIR
ncbi:MAG: type II secretion system protein N [Nitrospiraceae bacterium]